MEKEYYSLNEIWKEYGPCELINKNSKSTYYLSGRSKFADASKYIIEFIGCFGEVASGFWFGSIEEWKPHPDAKPLTEEIIAEGWVATDKDGKQHFYTAEPFRTKKTFVGWEHTGYRCQIKRDLARTFEDESIKVKIIKEK
jgi:hypothetical protein